LLRHKTTRRGFYEAAWRAYDDVAPFRGVYRGASDHVLSVSVSMRRLALEPRGTPGAPGLFAARATDPDGGLPARR
jgi:hypothetical protein